MFFGWAVVGAALVMMAVSAGLGFYNLTVYLRALVVERGFSVGEVSGPTSVFFLVSGLAGVPVANLIGRWDARYTVAVGAVAGARRSRCSAGSRRSRSSTPCMPYSARGLPRPAWSRARRS